MKSATKTNGARLRQESAQKPFTQTRLPDYDDSAANVTNSALCSVSLPADL